MLPGSRHVVSWPVEGGCPLEIVLARNWSSVGDADGTDASCHVVFRKKCRDSIFVDSEL